MADAPDITRNPDDSVTAMTFAETGVAAEPSLGEKNAGLTGAPAENMFNWPHLASMQWHRAQFARYVDGSVLLFSSWLSRNGVWSSTGVPALDGFLSDAGGVNSLVADVWVNPPSVDTGAVQMQVSVPKAGPHTFTASKDTYVFVPNTSVTAGKVSEADLTYIELPNLSLAPAPPAGTVLVWKVVTDAGAIASAAVQVPPFPVFKQVGIEIVSAGEMMVAGDVDIGGNTDMVGTLVVGDNVTMGDGPGRAHTINGSMTGTGTRGSGAITAPSIEATGAAPVDLRGGATVAATKSIIGDATTPLTMGLITALAKIIAAAAGIEGPASSAVALPEGATIPTGKALTMAGTATIGGGERVEAATIEGALIEFTSPGVVPTARQMTAGSDDSLIYNDGTSKLMHFSINGRVYATGDQEASLGLGLDGTCATTSVALLGLGVGGNVRVIVNGLIQISALPDTFELFLEEDQTANPVYTTIGSSEVREAEKDTSNVNDWQPFRLERIFASGGTIATFYRLRVRADPKTAAVKEVRLRVESERA